MTFVTEEMRALIGAWGPTTSAELPLEQDSLRRFVQAAMEDDPAHWNESGASTTRQQTLAAPPLYPAHASRRVSGSPDPLLQLAEDPDWDGADGSLMGGLPPLKLPLKRILNGGTEADLFRLVHIGDKVSSRSRYVSIDDKQGRSGAMVIVTIETEYANQDGEILARVRNTLIRR
jgi:hypothetical protein